VALLPDLRQYKEKQNPQSGGSSVEQLERLYQMEFNLNTPQSQKDKPALTDKHKAILEYLKNNGARTLKQIADSRRLGLPETRELLKDLIQQELIKPDGEQYRLPNN
jgi:DNA-binding MarR family transcriptional regulator